MKSHVWMNYGHQGDSIEITIRDFSGKKMDSFKFTGHDHNTIKKVFKTIKQKYNVNLFFREVDKDLEWLE